MAAGFCTRQPTSGSYNPLAANQPKHAAHPAFSTIHYLQPRNPTAPCIFGAQCATSLQSSCLYKENARIALLAFMLRLKSYLLVCLLLAFAAFAHAQRVGVVLSGGGASGLAHVGVLKALEENNVPIDFIAGTSMGALIGGMYAAGYPIDTIEALVRSDHFRKAATGKVDANYIFPFRQKRPNPSWGSISFSRDSIWRTILPSNVTNPAALDFDLMAGLSQPAAAAGYNFDSLYVPFRCLASDIEEKESVIFNSGHLSTAIRASMSYPFYLKPIAVNGTLMFDGGLYNNFPSDVMYYEFLPDVIIGSNVSYNFDPPEANDPLSQIKNMLVAKTDYTLPCQAGIVIEPELEIATFDFGRAAELIDAGYNATMAQLDSIQALVPRTESPETRARKRQRFMAKWKPLEFGNIQMTGLNKAQSNYVRNTVQPNPSKVTSLENAKRGYYTAYGDDRLESLYPTAVWNAQHENFDLLLDVDRARDLRLEVGGNFSSRPINTAYIGLKYQYLGRSAITVEANSYFGRLYGSSQLAVRMDVPWRIPFYLRGAFTLNRWDYFRSQATFFEDVKPSFLVQNESYVEGSAGVPVGRKGKIELGLVQAAIKDNYYQTAQFLSTDTADQTNFDGVTFYTQYEYNALNRKQYASAGALAKVSARYIGGTEETQPGSTSISRNSAFRYHEWLQLSAHVQHYYKSTGKLRLGYQLEGVWSGQEDFNNFTASILRAPAFQPTPESKTLFLQPFRAYKYLAFGHQLVYSPFNNVDVRLEGYVFQPYQELLGSELNTVTTGPQFDRRYTIAMAAAVYHSPVGPISFSTNYYVNAPEVGQFEEYPVTFLFHFGYIIFNKRAFD